MSESFSFVFGIVAIFSIINHKWVKLPTTIGLMLLSLLVAGLLYLIAPIAPEVFNRFCSVVYNADFEHILFNGILGFLLFAGALHINIRDLAEERKSILIFATLGVLMSTVLIGVCIYYTAAALNVQLPFVYALLFGALISPTDPIAVLAILKEANVTKSLQLKIEGESLFNDGIGVVVFSGILLLVPQMSEVVHSEEISKEIGLLFLEEAVGGIIYGLVLGFIGYRLMKWVFDEPKLAVLISIAIVLAGSALAQAIHVSAPLAMVVCGLFIGNKLDLNHVDESPGKLLLNEVWELFDEAFNGVLFVLIGLTIHLINFDKSYVPLAIAAVLIVLAARFISVFAGYSLLNHKDQYPLQTVKILTWGGLRGGISIALALSIGDYPFSAPIIFITYVVVLFSIIVQGLSLKKVVGM